MAVGAEIDARFISILPSFKGFARGIDKEFGPAATRAGRQFGDDFGRAVTGSMRASVGGAVRQAEAAVKKAAFVAKGAADDQAAATRKLIIAEKQLAELRGKSASTAQVLAGEKRLADARQKSARAALDARQAARDFAAAQKDAGAGSDAAAAAERRLADARVRHASAYRGTKVAAEQLAEVQHKGAASATQIARAEDRLADAQRAQRTASGRATAEALRHTEAQRALERELKQTARAAPMVGDSFRRMGREIQSGTKEAAGSKKRLGGALAGFASTLRFGAAGAGLAAGAAAGAGLWQGIKGASDDEQARGAVRSVFQSQAKFIEGEAARAVESVGLGQATYNQLAAVLGAGLKNQGVKDFAKQTTNLISLGADMAAQFGGETKDAVEAISSMMRGESDPIERYGVTINETAVNAELAAKGLSKLKGEQLTQAKAEARLAILRKNLASSGTIGQFGRESETFAQAQQKLGAELQNTANRLGEKFLPALTVAMNWLRDPGLPTLERFGGAIEALGIKYLPPVTDAFNSLVNGGGRGGGLKGIGAALQPLVAGLKRVGGAFVTLGKALAPVFKDIGERIFKVLRDNGPQIEATLSSLGASFTSFTKILSISYSRIAGIIGPLWEMFGPTILDQLTTAWEGFIQVFSGVAKMIEGIFDVLLGLFTGDWQKVIDGFDKITSGWLQTLTGAFEALFRTGENIFRALAKVFGAYADFAIKTSRDMRDRVAGYFRQLATWAASALTGLRDRANALIAQLRDWVVVGVRTLRDRAIGLVNQLRDWVIGGFRTIRDRANGYVGQLRDWVIGGFRTLRDRANGLIGQLRDWVLGSLRSLRDNAVGYATQAAQWVIGAFIDLKAGIISALGGLGSIAQGAFDAIRDAAKKPVKFVVETVIGGLVGGANKIASKVGLGPNWLPRPSVGFYRGGWTGPGAWNKPAGEVHADEFVIRKSSRRKFEKKFPGYLKHINDQGTMPGYAQGGLVTAPGGRQVAPVTGKPNRHTRGYGWTTYAADYPMPFGAPIRAWKDGVVVAANRWNYSYGHHIRLNHPDGTSSLYAHQSQLLADRIGQQVTAGQVIGRIGSTGNSTGPHVHFETRGGPYRGATSGAIPAVTSGPIFNPAGEIARALAGPLAKAKELQNESDWARLVGAIPPALAKGITSKIAGSVANIGADFAGKAAAVVSGSGAARWAAVAAQALALARQPLSLLPLLLRRMNVESGGNPRAINNWDINAKNGTPSKGLMQTIDPTFNAYAGPLRSRGVWDPLANIYAAIMYTQARYKGNFARAWNGTQGYDVGGYLKPGVTLAYNGTGRPEPIFTAKQWDNMQSNMADKDALIDVLTDALQNVSMRVDLDNGRAYFDAHYARIQRSDSLAVRGMV